MRLLIALILPWLTFFTIGVTTNFRKLWEEGIGRLAVVYVVCLFGFVRYLEVKNESFRMLARGESEHAHINIDVNKWHPHGYRIHGIDRPVVLVLVPGSGSAAGFLE